MLARLNFARLTWVFGQALFCAEALCGVAPIGRKRLSPGARSGPKAYFTIMRQAGLRQMGWGRSWPLDCAMGFCLEILLGGARAGAASW